MRLTTILLFLCALIPEVFAQTSTAVVFTPQTIDTAVDSRSSSVRLSALIAADATEGVAVSKNAYLPDINVNWQVGYLGNGYLTDRDFSAGMSIANPHFVNNFAVEAMQTIYSGGAVSAGVRMSELRAELAELSLTDSHRKVKFLMLSKLIELQCLYRQREVMEQNIELAQQVLEQMRVRVDQGLILENDLTRYELQIASLRLQLDRIDESITVANSNIATALDYPDGTAFQLQCDQIDEDYPLQPLEQWKSEAAQANLDMQKARLGIDMSRTGLRLTAAERLPRLSAFVYGNFTSPITIEVPVIDKNFMYWGFGLNVSYNLSSIYKTSKKMRQAKLSVAQSEEQLELAGENVTDELTRAYQAFLTAQSALRTQRYSLRLASQNYDTVSSRFDEGMALVTDLVYAANVRIAAQTGIENAQSNLLFCLYRLKFIANTL